MGRKLYAPHVEVFLPDNGKPIYFARMNLVRWAKLAEELRKTRIDEEMKAVGRERDVLLAQTLRMRAQSYEPTLGQIINQASTPTGMIEVFMFAGKVAGTSEEDVLAFMVSADPNKIVDTQAQIIHQPVVDPAGIPDEVVERSNPMLAAGINMEQSAAADTSGEEKSNPAPRGQDDPSTLNSLLAELGPPST